MATLPYNDWIWQLYPKSQRPKPPKPIVFAPVTKKSSKAARRREREQNGGAGWTQEQWLEHKASYGDRCLKCGTTERIVPDHVTPLKRGGQHELSNIQPLCNPCNRAKGLQIIDYRITT